MLNNQHMEVKSKVSSEGKYPNPEVKAKGSRRRFSTAYKLKILSEAENCTEPGELGALLRREGLYDSHLWRWRKAQEEGRLNLSSKREKKNARTQALKQTVVELEREKERLEKALEQAELVIDVQKKLSQLFGLEVMKVHATC